MGRWTPDSTYVGQTLAQIAKRRKTDPVTTLIDMIKEAQDAEAKGTADVESIIATSMDEKDVQKLLQWEYTNICTDGELDGRHPRGFGAFAKVLGPYVRDQKLFPLGEAIRKMTSLPARNVGIKNRGVIRKGAYADLVLFDPAKVADQSTPTDPQRPATGVNMVWVNGEVVYENGKTTGRYPGKVVRRK
jgi:N-acyl-D-amino-acid deacylase